jgi:hypothetical protein
MKLLKATIVLLWMLAMMMALALPFVDPLWFIYSFAMCIVAVAHGNDIMTWLVKDFEP